MSDVALAELGVALADAVEAALPRWLSAVAGDVPDEACAAALLAVVPPLRALLALDVDEQRRSPLALVRRATPIATALLHERGAPVPVRDDQQRALFPDDLYDLGPATWADLGPEVAEAGITWGAAKAWVHRQRHVVRP